MADLTAVTANPLQMHLDVIVMVTNCHVLTTKGHEILKTTHSTWDSLLPDYQKTYDTKERKLLQVIPSSCIRDVLIADHNYKSVRAARLGLTAERKPLEESLSDIFATSVSIAPNAHRGVPHHTAQMDLFLSYHRMVYPSIGGIPRWSSLATCGPVFIRNI
ncbi:hypothetical protein T4D_7878 [Trichinella pseudospiralis]|uniref:Uncharacterized protein n=1 Tax=Trichinella pseudospiralis TaxID=6337 RepID=A0A0V1G423_TRIPS|nr:hypothetical protein T4D_7878 [Trichinella pseudospiralis]